MSALEWMVALVVTALAAMLQGVVGLGFAMVSVPILSLIDPRLAPVPQLLITIPLTVSMAWRERHAMDLSGAAWIIAGRVPGALIGLVFLAIITGAALDVMIAVIVLIAVAIIASGYHVSRHPGTDFTAGVFSGTSSLVASIGGPPLALLYTNAEGETIRSSLAAVFSVGILITVGSASRQRQHHRVRSSSCRGAVPGAPRRLSPQQSPQGPGHQSSVEDCDPGAFQPRRDWAPDPGGGLTLIRVAI